MYEMYNCLNGFFTYLVRRDGAEFGIIFRMESISGTLYAYMFSLFTS